MIRIDDDDQIRTLTIDWPDRMNAIPPDGWESLHHHITEFELSAQRILIITGAGGNFCAGANLSDHSSQHGVADRHQQMQAIGAAANALIRSTKPTIAAVDGVAVGAGMNLALACDVVIATPEARFSEIFAKRGLTLDFGGSWLLPRIVGLQRAKEISLSGRIVSADEARQIGLCIDLVDQDQLLPRARELAIGFLGGAPVAQLLTKQALNRAFELALEQALSNEARSQAICLGSEDADEGVRAFIEKRSPHWRGR